MSNLWRGEAGMHVDAQCIKFAFISRKEKSVMVVVKSSSITEKVGSRPPRLIERPKRAPAIRQFYECYASISTDGTDYIASAEGCNGLHLPVRSFFIGSESKDRTHIHISRSRPDSRPGIKVNGFYAIRRV